MPDLLRLQTPVPRTSLCLPAELCAVRSPLYNHLDAWQAASEVSSTATTCPEMFRDCPVFLTQLSQPWDTMDSPGLSQVLVREITHIPQYLVSQDTQDVLGILRY